MRRSTAQVIEHHVNCTSRLLSIVKPPPVAETMQCEEMALGASKRVKQLPFDIGLNELNIQYMRCEYPRF